MIIFVSKIAPCFFSLRHVTEAKHGIVMQCVLYCSNRRRGLETGAHAWVYHYDITYDIGAGITIE